MLAIDGLTKRFGEKVAVDRVSLEIPAGSFVGVIGRSGAGKSTLLRMINRLAEPTSGRVSFDGVDVTALRGAALRRWRRDAAMIFQQFNLVGRLDVMTNVLLGRLDHATPARAMLGLWSDEDRALALSALDLFDMAALAAQRTETLSGGQQQRVAIARALVQEPRLVLADEPIASLDPRNTRLVMDGLQRMNRDYGITVICNLHALDVARSYCDRLVGMRAGRVVFDAAPEELTESLARDLYGLEAGEALGEVASPDDAGAPAVSAPVAA